MGILDVVSSVAGQLTGNQGNEKAQVAGGLMDELQNRSGGVGGLLQAFQQNGLGAQVKQWASGQTAPAEPEQMEQGLSGTGIIDSIAQRTGVPATVVKMGLAVAVPMLIHHFVSNNHVTEQGEPTGEQPEMGGVLKSVLGRLL